MLRESEIANFLDLIKHITQARNFKSTSTVPKSKKRDRYQNSQQTEYPISTEKKVGRNSLAIIETQQRKTTERKNQSEFEHKMLKITHQIKRKPRSMKMDSFYDEDRAHLQSDPELGKKVTLTRSSLYENYCEMIQRKRQQKITKLFRSSQHQISNNICNISDTVNFQNPAQNIKTFKQAPFIKSKTLKPGLENIKIKNWRQPKSKQRQNNEKSSKSKSKKKVQPQQLNIESLKSVKMPKLENVTRKKLFKIQKYASPYAKKNVINRIGNLEGWAQHDEDKNCFNIQYF